MSYQPPNSQSNFSTFSRAFSRLRLRLHPHRAFPRLHRPLRPRPLLRLCLALAALTFLSQCTTSSTYVPNSTLTIFYNNDQFGYLEPCGCRVNPIGGVHRRFNAMASVPQERRLFFDSGNLLFKSTTVPSYLSGQWLEQAKGLIEAYNLQGADAVGIGETDFANGVDGFLQLKEKAKFPFVNANVVYRKSGDPFLEPYTIVERAGLRIGVFGIFGTDLRLPSELRATDTIAAAKKQVRTLRGKNVDLVVMLSHQGFQADEALAQKVDGIDLIVGGYSQSFLQSRRQANGADIVQLSSQGQMLGKVEYKFAEGKPVWQGMEVLELADNLEKTPAGTDNPMKALIAVVDMHIADANRAAEVALKAKHAAKGAKYQTFLSCKKCHTVQAAFQDQFRHSIAFLTLVANKKETNNTCLKCHSVGLGEARGFNGVNDSLRDHNGARVDYKKVIDEAFVAKAGTDYRKTPALIKTHLQRWQESLQKNRVAKAFVGVQCENCHGTVEHHPFGTATHQPVRTNACTTCHTQEQMPDWYTASGELKESLVAGALKRMSCPK